MLSKLAFRNVCRQIGNYLIYFITVSMTVALLFAVNNIIFGEEIGRFSETISEFRTGLTGIVVFISLIVAFVLSYATSFMLKLRKREFGTYLTLGMSRRNILILFISETMFICLIALGLGLALGLVIYQGLMAIMMNLMEMEFVLSPYSLDGVFFTIVLVVAIFVLSSFASAIYLKRVSIYDLIHGDKKVEKKVKHPKLWFIITLASLVLIAGSCLVFNRECEAVILKGSMATRMMEAVLALGVGIILFHIGLARSIVFMLLRNKWIRSRGTSTFVLRQLSGTLGSNSVMIGFLAFLLTFAVIGSNVSFMQRVRQETALNQNYPYDITYCENLYEDKSGEEIPLDEAEQIIQKYVPIENKMEYTLYTSGGQEFANHTKWFGYGYGGMTDSFMSVSDFNKICEPLGYEPIRLENEFMVIANLPEVLQFSWEDFVFEWEGIAYNYKGCSSDYPMFCYMYFYIILPDAAVETMDIESSYAIYDVKDEKYDAMNLRKELSYPYTETYAGETYTVDRTDFRIREYSRQAENSSSAILVIGALFVSAIFLFLAMAILALKTLSGISEDRRRYQMLFRLGVSDRQRGRTLFRQTFYFFLMPFLAAVLMCFPTAIICNNIMVMNGFDTLAFQVYTISAGIALVMISVYIIYYAATYLIAKRAIVQFQI